MEALFAPSFANFAPCSLVNQRRTRGRRRCLWCSRRISSRSARRSTRPDRSTKIAWAETRSNSSLRLGTSKSSCHHIHYSPEILKKSGNLSWPSGAWFFILFTRPREFDEKIGSIHFQVSQISYSLKLKLLTLWDVSKKGLNSIKLYHRFPVSQIGASRSIRTDFARLRDRRMSRIVSKRRAAVFLS